MLRYANINAVLTEGAKLKKTANTRLAAGWLVFTVGVLALLLVFAMRNNSNNFPKVFGLLLAAGCGGGGAYLAHRDTLTHKLGTQYDKAARDRLSAELNAGQDLMMFGQDIQSVQDKLQLIGHLPLEQQYYWLQSQGLLGMVPHSPASEAPPAMLHLRPRGTMAIDTPEFDTTWLTPEFAYSSKVVVSERGGGKTNYLRWEIGQIKYDELILCDPHLLANQMEAGGAVWLDCTIEEERRFVAHTSDQIKAKLAYVLGEGRARLRGEGKSQSTIKMIFDEGDAEEVIGRDGCVGELLEFLRVCANEFRKVKIEITLVLHTLKKGQTGIDASILSQFSWLIMGGFGASPDVVWPSDFDAKLWSAQREAANSQLPQSKARACILRSRGNGQSKIEVVTMPAIATASPPPQVESVPPTTTTEGGDRGTPEDSPDLFGQLRAILGEQTTLERFKAALGAITRQIPSDQALYFAIDRSGIQIVED